MGQIICVDIFLLHATNKFITPFFFSHPIKGPIGQKIPFGGSVLTPNKITISYARHILMLQ